MPTDEPGVDIDGLKHTVEDLQKENEVLRGAEEPKGATRPRHRLKAVFSWVLVVLACILAVVSVFAAFARNELLNTDTFVSTFTPLASNPAIQKAVAARVSDQLATRTDVEQRVKNALPAKAGFLAVPLTSEVKNVADQLTLKLVQTSAFQKLWAASVRKSHQQVVALLTGSEEGAFQSSNGEVTVDLSQIEAAAKKQLDAKGLTVFNKVPTVHGPDLVLFRSTQLAKAQRLTKLANSAVLILPIVTLLAFAGGILLTENRRKGLVRAAAGLALTMALLLVVASVARNQYLNSLLPSQPKDAAAAVIDTVSAVLLDTIRTILIVSALVALGAFIAGNSHVRSWVGSRSKPSWMTGGPVHDFVAAHRKGLQWAVLGVGLLILVVWNQPTPFVAVIVVLITLAVIGLVGLYAGAKPRPQEEAPSLEAGAEPAPALGSGPAAEVDASTGSAEE